MSSTTTNDEDCETPICNDCGELLEFKLGKLNIDIKSSCPWKGRCFIIRDPTSLLVITLHRGVIKLVPEFLSHGSGIHWVCVESETMLLGFENMVSGTFLGRNNKRCIAEAKRQQNHESFCVRRHPNGGYILLVNYGSGFLPIGIDEKRQLIVCSNRDKGVAWEFERVASEMADH